MSHELSAENPELPDHFMISGQELDGADSYKEGRIQQPLVPTTVFKNMTTTNDAGKQENSFNNTLIFIDESQQHLSGGAGPSEGYIAKRHLGHSQGATSVSSPYRGSLINSPAVGAAGHKKTKSFTEFTELDIGKSQLMPCPSYTQKSTSATWPSYPNVLDSPLTPTLSSYSDDITSRSNWTEFPSLGSPDSWGSGKGFSENSPPQSGHLSEEPGAYGLQETLSNSDVYPCGNGAFYGYDSGAADEDLLKNDDAITVVLLPSTAYNSASGVVDFGEEAMPWQIRDRMSGLNQYYYKNVVPVVIPWALEPLPDIEAAHRSQLLETGLPQMRMAEWAQSVFPALRESLLGASSSMPNVTLAMAVMLIALEIMSPGAFGRGVSWREHVAHARGLLAKCLDHGPQDTTVEGMWFIQSWLGYIDVMGGLMAGPLLDMTCKSQVYFPPSETRRCANDLDEIDCMMGISVKCARLLGQVAELAKQCQGERFRLDGQLLQGWCPQPTMVEQALLLEKHLMESLRQSSRPCPHVRAGSIHMRDLAEMAGVNEAFHWAGMIHLHRRVLGKATDHPDVQGSVRRIMQCLEQIGTRGVAKTRYLFPIFTAGCEALTERQQTKLLGRLTNAEKSGMKQQVWTTGKAWEELICNEFVA
ncbi:hypothetical protein VCV18_005689 [Metarhizium anisopliae]